MLLGISLETNAFFGNLFSRAGNAPKQNVLLQRGVL
jgi:hypothetical protein